MVSPKKSVYTNTEREWRRMMFWALKPYQIRDKKKEPRTEIKTQPKRIKAKRACCTEISGSKPSERTYWSAVSNAAERSNRMMPDNWLLNLRIRKSLLTLIK